MIPLVLALRDRCQASTAARYSVGPGRSVCTCIPPRRRFHSWLFSLAPACWLAPRRSASTPVRRRRRSSRTPTATAATATRTSTKTSPAGATVSVLRGPAAARSVDPRQEPLHQLPHRHRRGAAPRRLQAEAGGVLELPPPRDRASTWRATTARRSTRASTKRRRARTATASTHALLNSRNPASPVNRANLTKTCGRCHANVAEMRQFNLRQDNPIVSYETSVHGIALLAEEARSTRRSAPTATGRTTCTSRRTPSSKLYWRNVPATCGKCHENVERTYVLERPRQGAWRRACGTRRSAPTATASTASRRSSCPRRGCRPRTCPDTCAQCHAAHADHHPVPACRPTS